MRVIVTGASGFLGAHVVTGLATTDAEVVAVSRRSVPLAHHVLVRDYDRTPPGDVLVHLAETGKIAAVERAGQSARDAAVRCLSKLLDKRYGLVVYISSAAVYGDTAGHARGVDEPPGSLSEYSRLKLDCERLALEAGGLVLRLANAYGPGMSKENVMSRLLSQIGGTGPVEVWDDNPVRDYLWVEDAVSCLAALLQTRARGVFNVGSGVGTSVRELGTLMLRLARQPDRPIVSTQPTNRRSQLVVDISATTAQCGWKPRVALAEGVERMLGQYR